MSTPNAAKTRRKLRHSFQYCLQQVPAYAVLGTWSCRCGRNWRWIDGGFKLVVFSAGLPASIEV